jgi:hypothetical protein
LNFPTEALARLNFFRDLLIQHHRDQNLPMPSKVDGPSWCFSMIFQLANW